MLIILYFIFGMLWQKGHVRDLLCASYAVFNTERPKAGCAQHNKVQDRKV